MRLLLVSATVLAVFGAGFLPRVHAAGREELFIRKGVELRRKGKDQDALIQFRRAYDIGRTPRAAAQLGLCEQSLEDWLAAQQHLAEALMAESDPWIAQNRNVLESARAETEAHLVRVRVDGTPDGAMVVVNGEVAGPLPSVLPMFVSPGAVSITVSAEGHEPYRETKMGTVGQTLDFSVSLAPMGKRPSLPPNDVEMAKDEPLSQTTQSTETHRSVQPPAWPGWTAVAAGITLIGTGVAFGAKASGDARDARESPVYDDDLVSSANSARTLQWVLLGAGAATTAAGVALLLRSKFDESTDVSVSPRAGGGLLHWGGRF